MKMIRSIETIHTAIISQHSEYLVRKVFKAEIVEFKAKKGWHRAEILLAFIERFYL